MPSFISWLFTKKNIIDPSYISCHSHLWNFKKKKISNLIKNISVKIPIIKDSGALVGNFKDTKSKIYNGMHDTSAAFHFHRNFFQDQNSVFLSTGTTFVFGKFLNTINSIKKELRIIEKEVGILSRRFHGGLMFEKLQKRKTKSKKNYLPTIK